MRWNHKPIEDLSKKIVKRFLFFPKCIDGQFRWLEFVTLEKIALCDGAGLICWVDVRFVD